VSAVAVRTAFRYAADVFSADGAQVLGTVPVASPDWEPAVQWAYLQSIRRTAGPVLMHCVEACVEPDWDDALGRPFVASLRVWPGSDPAGPGVPIPARYLRAGVEAAVQLLVAEGRLEAGAPFRYRLRGERAACIDQPVDEYVVERIPPRLEILERRLADVADGAVRRDAHEWTAEDLVLVVRPAVTEEATRLARGAGQLETGGLLVGVLCRDPGSEELFIEVRAQIPAQHTHATADRLTFTAETWAAALADVARRGNGECLLGYWHSHPFFCTRCPAESQEHCRLSRPFLSDHDRALQRAVFARAFDVALVVSDRGPFGYECGVFGWRHGLLERRGWYGAPGAAPLVGGDVPSGNSPCRTGGADGTRT
jgi:hypothetical protein